MLSKRLVVGSAILGSTIRARQFNACAAVQGNRMYISVRHEWEFNQLIALPNPLLANFMFPADSKSEAMNAVFKKVLEGETPILVRGVDVEVDEPDVRVLLQRFFVSKYPTVVALEGGEQIVRLEPKGKNEDELEKELRGFIQRLVK